MSLKNIHLFIEQIIHIMIAILYYKTKKQLKNKPLLKFDF